MAVYNRTTAVDAAPGGDTVKSAILDLDTDLTAAFAGLNDHDASTAEHGATGAVVGTTNAQTLTNKTLTAPTISDADLTGIPTAPTPAVGTATDQVATCALVASTSFTSSLPGQTGNAGKFVTTDGANASWADVIIPFLAVLAVTSISSITYNADGSLNVLTYATGNKVTYGYTSGVLITAVYTDTDGITTLFTETITYTDGNVSAVTWS